MAYHRVLKDSDAGRDWGQEEKGTTEDEMAGWHHQLDGREFEWTPGVSDGQGGLACCDSWSRKESDTTERLNWTDGQGGLLTLRIRNTWSGQGPTSSLIVFLIFVLEFRSIENESLIALGNGGPAHLIPTSSRLKNP